MLFIATNFSYKENSIEHQANNENGEENGTKHQHYAGAPVWDHPNNVQRDSQKDKANAKGYEHEGGSPVCWGNHVGYKLAGPTNT